MTAMTAPIRVTDLDEFSLTQIWRPYWPSYDRDDIELTPKTTPRLDRPPIGLIETTNALMGDGPWSRLVIGRLARFGVEFPDWIRHPMADVVTRMIAERQFADSLPTDLEVLRAEAAAAVTDQAWAETLTDEEEVSRLKAVIRAIMKASEDGEPWTTERATAIAENRPVNRYIVHTRVNGFGADWDRDDVLAAISRATGITWRFLPVPSPGNAHQLILTDPGSFDGEPFAVGVTRPAAPVLAQPAPAGAPTT